MTALSDFIARLQNGDPETIVAGIGIFLIFVIALLIDKLIHGEDASNTWRRHD